MFSIDDFREIDFGDSAFIKPRRFAYTLGSSKVPMAWDLIKVHDCVCTLLFHAPEKSFILVEQFRPALFVHQKEDKSCAKPDGLSIELCSGIVDKNLSLEQIAREECLEETGYLPQIMEPISTFYAGFGTGASKQSLFFASVSEEDKKGRGGGLEDELIRVIKVPVKEYESFIKTRPTSALSEFAYLWFLANKKHLI